MSLCSCDVITNTLNGSRLTSSGFWMVEHQLVSKESIYPKVVPVTVSSLIKGPKVVGIAF